MLISGRDFSKRGASTVCKFKEGGLGKKERGVFEGVLIP